MNITKSKHFYEEVAINVIKYLEHPIYEFCYVRSENDIYLCLRSKYNVFYFCDSFKENFINYLKNILDEIQKYLKRDNDDCNTFFNTKIDYFEDSIELKDAKKDVLLSGLYTLNREKFLVLLKKLFYLTSKLLIEYYVLKKYF